MKNFPVFVFPVSLEFYLNARHTHKQLLTVYNPYDFSVNFKVLCTSPNKFTVIDPEGVIAPQSCIDIVVRYTQPSIAHCDTTEKFRITMYDRNTQQALGKRDIPTKLIEGEPSSINQESLGDSFHPLAVRTAPVRPIEEQARITTPQCHHPSHHREQQPVNVVAVAVSICCIAALLLPTQPELVPKSQWPEWLHIGSNLKLVFSFVLGLNMNLERHEFTKERANKDFKQYNDEKPDIVTKFFKFDYPMLFYQWLQGKFSMAAFIYIPLC